MQAYISPASYARGGRSSCIIALLTNMSSSCNAIRRLADVKCLWSRREYSMSNFLSEHGQRVPVLIFITEGYDGADDFHSVSVEDVSKIANTLYLHLANKEVGL